MRTFVTLAGVLLSLVTVWNGTAVAEHPAFTRSNAAFRAGDYAAAAADLEVLLAATPAWPAGWVRLGQCRYMLGDSAAGEAAMRRAAEVDPATQLDDAYRDVGKLLYQARRYDEAVMPLQRTLASVAARDVTRRNEIRETLAYAQYQALRYEDARRTLEEHLLETGFAVEPAWYLALSCQRLGDYACALEHLEAVADDGGARRGRALEYLARWSRFYAERGTGDRLLLRAAAVRHAGGWFREEPGRAEAAELYGATMLAAGRAAQLAEELEEALGEAFGGRSQDDNCQVSLQLARAYNDLDRRESAEDRGLRALACDPTSADAAVEVAYSRAARLRPEHTELVAVLEDRALAQSALASIAQARRLDPTRPQRAEELQRQLLETLARLEEAAAGFQRDETDYRRRLEQAEREAVRQRCLSLLWIRSDESRSLSDDERRFFDEHDCRQYAR